MTGLQLLLLTSLSSFTVLAAETSETRLLGVGPDCLLTLFLVSEADHNSRKILRKHRRVRMHFQSST